MRTKFKRLLSAVAPAVLLLAMANVARADGNFHGAIFTTVNDGLGVNVNQFASKDDVYLNGGPQNNSANGLPDGNYYFQVTDPSGQVLLSTDDITCRGVTVVDGRFAGNDSAPCVHPNGTQDTNNNSIPVKLMPFDDTPNNGGVYKVWLTKQSDYDATKGNFGFIDGKSKTDNFKVVEDNPPPINSTIIITKYNDINGNGTNDGEAPLDGWHFVVTIKTKANQVVATTVVDPTSGADGPGEVDIATLGLSEDDYPLSYEICEVAQAGWVQTEPAGGACYNSLTSGTIDTPGAIASFTFGNHQCTLTITCPPPVEGQCDGDIPAAATDAAGFVAQGGTISDDCDANPTVTSSDSPSGTGCKGDPKIITRTYTVVDAYGTTQQCTQTITIEDDTAPTVECPAPKTVDADAGSCTKAVEFSATAHDNCDANPSISYTEGGVPVSSGDLFTVGTHTIQVVATDACGNASDPCEFTITVNGSVTGHKYFDPLTNGTGTTGVGGWTINVYQNKVLKGTATTLSDGSYAITGLAPGSYDVVEGDRANWVATQGTSRTVVVGCPTADFYNVCLGAGGGLTLGFWSNNNGQAIMKANDNFASVLTFLSGLNLRNANGTDFNPASYTAFRTWILGATATNMANMLSAQLAAMELNVRYNKVSGSALIYAPGATSANPAGFATVNALMAEANAELGLHGTTVAASPTRTYQELLKTALDKANNNLNFAQSAPCK